MASLKSAQSSNRIIQKLEKLLTEENFYEAHQLYRTVYFRYINSKKFDELENLLLEGALTLLEKKQFNSGADLSLLYIDTLNTNPNIKEELEKPEKSEKFVKNVSQMFFLIPRETPEHLNFCVKFSKLNDEIFPLPQIHHTIAKRLWLEENNYKDARLHFFKSAKVGGSEAAQMLVEFQKSSGGPEEEVQLLIVQFILQLLCMTKKAKPAIPKPNKSAETKIDLRTIQPRSPEHEFAITTLIHYTKEHPKIKSDQDVFDAPLLNFLTFLLITIESGILDTYNVLQDVYKADLSKDPCYQKYLKLIAQIFFNVKPARSGGFLESFLQQFMQDSGDESEPNSSSESSQSRNSNNQNRPAMPSSIFNRLMQSRPSNPNRPNNPSNFEAQQDDLD